jgi:hypothetical protein
MDVTYNVKVDHILYGVTQTLVMSNLFHVILKYQINLPKKLS